jgi:hypothetical protein
MVIKNYNPEEKNCYIIKRDKFIEWEKLDGILLSKLIFVL